MGHQTTSNCNQNRASYLAKKVLHMLGWTLDFAGLPTSHGIIVVYPHTSNWDFCLGMLARWSIGIQIHFLVKDSLFKYPLLGGWLRSIGGQSVNRDSPHGYVAFLASQMQSQSNYWLAITPEGTRKKTPGWKSGFYHLAKETGYPVGFAYIDYPRKSIQLRTFLYMTGDIDQDFSLIREVYDGKLGLYPEKMSPIQFISRGK